MAIASSLLGIYFTIFSYIKRESFVAAWLNTVVLATAETALCKSVNTVAPAAAERVNFKPNKQGFSFFLTPSLLLLGTISAHAAADKIDNAIFVFGLLFGPLRFPAQNKMPAK